MRERSAFAQLHADQQAREQKEVALSVALDARFCAQGREVVQGGGSSRKKMPNRNEPNSKLIQ